MKIIILNESSMTVDILLSQALSIMCVITDIVNKLQICLLIFFDLVISVDFVLTCIVICVFVICVFVDNNFVSPRRFTKTLDCVIQRIGEHVIICSPETIK